jgi:hypothetical protein
MLKFLLLCLSVTITIIWGLQATYRLPIFPSIDGLPPNILPIQEVSMSTHHNLVQSIRLIAREQRKPPIGVSPKTEREAGFATVFLTTENIKQQSVQVTIQKIQIEDVMTNHIYLENQIPQEIHLKPLENSINDFHLMNKVGYSTQNQVKAVVTYQVDRQIYVIESDPVEIERN